MTKQKLIFGILLLAITFALGRYSNNKPDIKTSEVAIVAKDKEINKHVETVTTKDAAGNVKIVTTVDTIARSTEKDKTISKTEEKSNVNTLNISGLAGYDFHQNKVIYGGSVTKQLIGPITIGAFGLSNCTFGLSIGLEF